MNSSPFIIISFPRFAGGKFISNCLSLSRHCCPQDLITAKHILTNPNDYQYRLNRILTTIPPTKSDMKRWITDYEFGDTQLYGSAFTSWQSGTEATVNSTVQQLMLNGIKLFVNAHGGDQSVRNLCKVWPDAPIIKLINHTQFSEISQRLKSECEHSLEFYAGNYCKTKYNQLSGPSWPRWERFESVGYDPRRLTDIDLDIQNEILNFYNWKDIDSPDFTIDVDNCYFDQIEFLKMIENLYNWLDFDDFDSDLIKTYWSAYITMHQI